jgi:hypothetical protein
MPTLPSALRRTVVGLELDVLVVVAPEDVARHVLDVPVLVVLEVVAAECMARRNVLHVLEALVVVVLVVVTAEVWADMSLMSFVSW